MCSFEEATTKFIHWLLNENVVISPNVEIKDLREYSQGRGMIATTDIGEDEELFSIPRETIISIDNCSLTKNYTDMREKLLKLNHWESLVIILLYELYACENSRWNDYFNTLPIKDSKNYQFNQLMFWSSPELNELSPSLVVQRIGKEEADNMFHKLFPKVICDDLGISELHNITIEQYHKVASLIMSYSFDVERPDFDGEIDNEDEEEESEEEEEPEFENESSLSILKDGYFKSMVPLADILNADTKLHNASLMYTPSALVMKSIKPIAKGDQIYNTYSDHPNSEILRRYGYVEENGSNFDFGEIPLRIIEDYFTNTMGLPTSLLKDIYFALDVILEEDEDFVQIILDSYDCFNDSEVILELIFLIQILSIATILYRSESLELTSEADKHLMILRICKKCYQLIESKKLTNSFMNNYELILKLRINEYPKELFNKSTGDKAHNRKEMARIVLQSEYESLINCLDVEKVFKKKDTYKFIDDGKLIRNITKKRTIENVAEEDNTRKRQR